MDKPIRIAQIMGKLWAGGVEMVVFNYYREIDKSKVQFDFYYDSDSTVEPPQELIDMGAKFIKIPPYQRLPEYLKTLNRYFKENEYTIVHSHINTLSVFPLYAAWKSKIPVRIAHNHSVPGGKEYKKNLLKYFLRMFSRVFATDYFACSEKAGRWLFGNKNFEDGNIEVIKNAIKFERFSIPKEITIDLKIELGLENKFVIGHIGRFTFAKNHKYLIEMFKQLLTVKENAVLMLVGDGELNEDIHNWVKENSIEEKVIFVGKVKNPEYYYGLADVIVIPSIFEGLSLTAIESQVAGVPVITSRAVPKEAVISNGCIRMDLDRDSWVKEVLQLSGQKVVLDKNSQIYNIETASKKLQNIYINKVGDNHA